MDVGYIFGCIGYTEMVKMVFRVIDLVLIFVICVGDKWIFDER